MYTIIKNLINYSGTYNLDQYICYACIALILLFTVLVVDWIAKLIGKFF